MALKLVNVRLSLSLEIDNRLCHYDGVENEGMLCVGWISPSLIYSHYKEVPLLFENVVN